VLVAGCGRSSPEEPGRYAASASSRKSLGNGFFDAVHKGADEAGKELDAEVIFVGPTTPDRGGSDRNAELAHRSASGCHRGLGERSRRAGADAPGSALDRGIKVISYDSAVAAGGRNAHLAPSSDPLIGENVVALARGARAPGRWKGAGKIRGRFRDADFDQSERVARRDAQGSRGPPGLEMVGVAYGDDVSDKSYREAVALLQQHPDLNVLVSIKLVGNRRIGARG